MPIGIDIAERNRKYCKTEKQKTRTWNMKRDRYSPTKATGATKVIAFWDPLLRKALGSPNIPVRNHWSMTCHLLYKNETFNDADVIFDMRHNILLNNPETFPNRTRSDQLYFFLTMRLPCG